MDTKPSSTPAPAAAATPPPTVLKPEAVVEVPGPGGVKQQVPVGTVLERYAQRSELDRQAVALSQQRQTQEQYINFAKQFEQRAKLDPKGAVAEMKQLAERLSGQSLGDPATPPVNEADMSPFERQMMAELRAVRGELGQVKAGRSMDQARTEIGTMLDKFELFRKSPGARQFAEVIAAEMKSKDPSTHADDIGSFVHDQVMRLRQEAINDAVSAREAAASGAPSGLPPGLGMPGLSDQEPMRAGDAKNGRMRAGIKSMVEAAWRGAKP